MHVGVFGNADSWYVSELCRVGTRLGHRMSPLRFEEFECRVLADGITWSCSGVTLNQLDAILVRTMPPGTLEQVVARMDMLGGLSAAGVLVVNSPRAIECAVDKYLTTQRLQQSGLPVPATIVCESAENALQAYHDLDGDVIVKPIFGAEGRGILRITEEELAVRSFRTLERLGAVLYIQQFIPQAAHDLRLLLLDGQLMGAMKRRPVAGEFRANVAQQGQASAYTPTPQEIALSRAACTAIDCLFAGVDLMYDSAGQPQIIEINAVPGWRALEKTQDVHVAEKLLNWLDRQVCP